MGYGIISITRLAFLKKLNKIEENTVLVRIRIDYIVVTFLKSQWPIKQFHFSLT